ncbi:MAG TPA: hypothetical protein VFG63_17005 [Nocardioidaceae bacterium]|nr:hypothetical protein [Nocardioidaceae bacterium]
MKRGAALSITALLLTGCGGPAGIERERDNAALESCLAQADLSIEDSDEWSDDQERAFLSKPVALDCVLDEVGPGKSLDGAMHRAFGESSSDEVRTVLTSFVAAREADARTQARDVGELLAALGSQGDAELGLGVRAPVAFAIHRVDEGTPPAYTSWLSQQHREDDPDSVVDFYQEQETQGSPLYRSLDAIENRIRAVQHGELD